MNELPKLEIFIRWDDDITKHIKGQQAIALETYKSQIAFYEKYKDNIELFYYEFDEYKSFIDEWAIKYPNNKLYIEDLFKDWLFNKLFKLEE